MARLIGSGSALLQFLAFLADLGMGVGLRLKNRARPDAGHDGQLLGRSVARSIPMIFPAGGDTWFDTLRRWSCSLEFINNDDRGKLGCGKDLLLDFLRKEKGEWILQDLHVVRGESVHLGRGAS